MTAAAAAAITIVLASFDAATVVYARNTTVQQQVANITNATNATTTISRLNASYIINAINAKIKAIYDHDHSNIEIPTNSELAIITRVDNRSTAK
jgi:hypothetical protein